MKRALTCVVTGATSGIGFELARILASRGATVIGAGRDPARCRAAEARLRGVTGNGRVRFEVADLSSLDEVRSLARRILAASPRIDVLVNNAGGFAFGRRETVDGIELQLALNYLSGFLLTRLLLPAMEAAGAGGTGRRARVIMVSSGSHFSGRMHWRGLGLGSSCNGLAAYARSKLACVLFARELARRLGPDSPISTYAVDPGLVRTEIGLKGTGPLVRLIWRLRTRQGISPSESAATIAFLALDPLIESRTGLYWKGCLALAPSKHARNADDARRLWDLSEGLCAGPCAGFSRSSRARSALTGGECSATFSA